MEIKIVVSGDGSHTLYLPGMDETYHSLHGAMQETMHVFIEAGLNKFLEKKNHISILEIGFGTGLNALMTYRETLKKDIFIEYHTLEPFPLPAEIYRQLNYPSLIHEVGIAEVFSVLHESAAGDKITVSPRFSFVKYLAGIEAFNPSPFQVDLVYFDAFAPKKQPPVWVPENLNKIHGFMANEGVLVTYCAGGQFRRDLKNAGFRVEILPGPPGKKEMTRAQKIAY